MADLFACLIFRCDNEVARIEECVELSHSILVENRENQ